nr:carbohydrate kinase family protein [Candidatus Njordarchaeum guaymaensis]
MLVTCAGILVSDIIASGLPKVSDPGEVTFAPSGIRLCVGGHAANVSIDLMKLGLRRGEVGCVGAVGMDAFGDFMIEEIEKYDIVTHIERVKKAGTSLNMILVVKGEDRRFHVDVGASSFLCPRRVLGVLREEKPLIFYLGATGFLGQFDEQLPSILKEAKRLGCITFVDPIQPHGHGYELLVDSFEWIDVLHCNNVEAESMTSKRDSKESLNVFTDRGVKLAVITVGEKGLSAKLGYERVTMPAFKVPVVDPTGAGDAFCASVIHYLTKLAERKKSIDIRALTRSELIDLLLEGEAAGAACVTEVGTTKAVTQENVNRILREQKKTIMGQIKVDSKPR